MKILFVSNLYPPNVIGGYERLCFDVASFFVIRGHKVAILTSNYGNHSTDYVGQNIYRTLELLADNENIYAQFHANSDEISSINQKNSSSLISVIENEKPDVVYVWNLYFLDSAFIHELDNINTRIVFMITDNWLVAAFNGNFMEKYFIESVFDVRDKGLLKNIRSFYRNKFLQAETVASIDIRHDAIFGAQFVRNIYTEAGFKFRSAKVIHNGVKLEAHPEASFRPRGKLIDPKEVRLLIAGRVVEVKGVHVAIEALSLLAKKARDGIKFALTIVGETSDERYLSRIKDLIQSKGLEDQVVMRGPVVESELFSLFQQYDIYIFPSLYEPFSLTLIHALAAGIPTIASDAGGNIEIIVNKKTGIVCPKGESPALASAILKMINRPKLREYIARRSRSAAMQFTFERMVSEMEAYLFRGQND